MPFAHVHTGVDEGEVASEGDVKGRIPASRGRSQLEPEAQQGLFQVPQPRALEIESAPPEMVKWPRTPGLGGDFGEKALQLTAERGFSLAAHAIPVEDPVFVASLGSFQRGEEGLRRIDTVGEDARRGEPFRLVGRPHCVILCRIETRIPRRPADHRRGPEPKRSFGGSYSAHQHVRSRISTRFR
jgi:hypothetical protein